MTAMNLIHTVPKQSAKVPSLRQRVREAEFKAAHYESLAASLLVSANALMWANGFTKTQLEDFIKRYSEDQAKTMEAAKADAKVAEIVGKKLSIDGTSWPTVPPIREIVSGEIPAS